MDRIEILSVEILDQYRPLVEKFRELSRELSIGLGWHYLLDLSWIARELDPHPGMTVLDAGAGTGLMQWWMSEQGVDVISVDRGRRWSVSPLLHRRYPIRSWRGFTRLPGLVRALLPPRRIDRWPEYPAQWLRLLRLAISGSEAPKSFGTVKLWRRDLSDLSPLQDGSVDAVVSVSALEHNAPEQLSQCVEELLRILRPGGRLIATLGAGRDRDWFHKPSHGWCYTEATLKQAFRLPGEVPSNYKHYDVLLAAIRACSELRDNLDPMYSRSGENGMPWGRWDPQYQPVGVVRTRA